MPPESAYDRLNRLRVIAGGRVVGAQVAEAAPENPAGDTIATSTEAGRKGRKNGRDGGGGPAGGGGAPGHDVPESITEDAAALAFSEAFDRRFVHDHTEQTWFYWAGDRWLRDTTSLAFDEARGFCRGLREDAEKPSKSLSKMSFVNAVVTAAKADRRMAVSHELWDRDGWLLGVPGGVVDLRSGELREGQPGDFISKQTTVAPAPPGTPMPLWWEFLLAATQRDMELIGFLQRLCGYCLTGDVSEEVLSFFYGPGGNGKGVFIGALAAIMGNYALNVPIEVFTAGSRLNLEYYRAQMFGTRLITASETEAGAQWAESQIKEMTGNETPLSARSPYGKPFNYQPWFKIAIVGNHAPKLKGRNPAMERRLRIVPFTHAPETPDPHLKEKLRVEYPAILRWMIDGCVSWREKRLGTAEVIKKATSDYFEQQDGFRRWLDERCILDAQLRTRPGVLASDFQAWAKANGEEAVSSNEFAELVNRTPGLKRTKTEGVPWVRGIGFKVESREDGRDG